MTIIYFAGTRLDHGDADVSSSNEADYLERWAAPPPVVVRGYDEAGNPVSVIRAGKRIEDAVLTPASALTAYGWDPVDTRRYWRFSANDEYGAAVDAYSRQSTAGTSQLRPPPFSFRPHAALPMPNGHLFCLAAPLEQTYDLAVGNTTQYQFAGLYREYYRVYRRNGDWVQDFPADLHGAPIHDAVWDGDGNGFIAGDEVGAERYSFRKYNSAYALQWSVSFKDYWPLSSEAVRITQTDFDRARAQFDQRRGSVKIEIAPDGSLYVISEVAVTVGYMFRVFRSYRRDKRFALIARVSALGAILWVRVIERGVNLSVSAKEPDRNRYTCKALGDKLALFYRGGYATDVFAATLIRDDSPRRYSVGEIGGDYSWDKVYQIYKTDANRTYQELHDHIYVGRIDVQNGWIVDEDGGLDGYLFPSNPVVFASSTIEPQGVVVENKIYPESLIDCVMRYADDRFTVFGRRFHWNNANDIYNIDPEYVRHVFYNDLTLLSATEITGFDASETIAVAEDGSTYYDTRATQGYGPAMLASSLRSMVVANHFKATDATGDPLWAGITATARLGLNEYGKTWRDYGFSRSNDPPFYSIPAGSTPAQWQAAHDDFVAHVTAHGGTASGDLLALSGFQFAREIWRPASEIAIVYDSVTPALALPVFLGRPTLIGPVTTHAPGLPLELALRLPVLRRDYVGPLLPAVHRLTLGDLAIPFSVLTVRKAAFEVTVSAVCPAASEPLVAALIARDTETLTVWRGVRFRDGREQLEVLLETPLTGLRYDRGARSGSITLDGRYTPTDVPARARAVVGLERMETRGGLRVWSSPLPDIFLNPGDTVVLGSESFTAGQVEYQISPTTARMVLREAE